MMEEEPVADMVRETYRIIRKAMDKGVADNVIPAAMARKLDNSAFLFSGFKTAQELKEASLLLREKDGTVKGFSRFLTDIRRIDANYNVRYLEAEYNFAVSSAQMAASWAEVSQDGDRYDLQYRTAGDDHVREEHRALNGVTLPRRMTSGAITIRPTAGTAAVPPFRCSKGNIRHRTTNRPYRPETG